MASIKPLGQRVLVKRLDAEEVSAGGIVLPDTAQEKPQEAQVVSLGTGGKDENGNDTPARHVPPTFGDFHLIWRNQRLKTDLFLNYNGQISFNDLAISEINKGRFVFLKYTTFMLLKDEESAAIWKEQMSAVDLKKANQILNTTN